MQHTGAGAMKPIWADLSKKWNGFRLTRYSLDFDKVRGLPLAEERLIEGKIEKNATTVSIRFLPNGSSMIAIVPGPNLTRSIVSL